jgi:hypothetical protein
MPPTRRRGKVRAHRHRFTKEECQRGYARALEVCMERGWDAYAWIFRRVRTHYRRKDRSA